MNEVKHGGTPKPCKVRPPHDSCQPSHAVLRQDHRVDATFGEVVEACLRTVQISYVLPRKSKR